jgi:hypothetical protein
MRIAPHGAENLLARKHVRRVAHEVGEQVELLGGQGDVVAVAGDSPGQQVELDSKRLQPRRLWLGRCAQVRAHARGKLVESKGLGDVVDGPGVEAADAVVYLAARRQHDHTQPGSGSAQRLEDLDPVQAGQHAVEHDQREVLRERERQGIVAPCGDGDAVAFGTQTVVEEVGDRCLVFGYENAHHASVAQALLRRCWRCRVTPSPPSSRDAGGRLARLLSSTPRNTTREAPSGGA